MQKVKWGPIEVVLLEDMTDQSSWEEMECLQTLQICFIALLFSGGGRAVRDRVSLFSPGCPGSSSADQSDLKLRSF